jgi:hypothetical protein
MLRATRAGSRSGVAFAALLLLCMASPLRAQTSRESRPLATAPASPVADGWVFRVTPYAWLTALDGRVGVGPLETDVDLGVGDVLSALRFAAMATGDARHGALIVGLDAIYATLGSGAAVAVRGDTGSFELDQDQLILHPVAGYALRGEAWAVDLLIGARYWHLGADLNVEGPRGGSRSRTDSRDWVDATLGARAEWTAAERWRVTLGGDGGGGGSRSSWQAVASGGYDVSSAWTIGLAYRALWVDYDRERFVYDVTQRGFLLNGTYRF